MNTHILSLKWSIECARSWQYLLIYLYQTCTQKFLLNWKDICLSLICPKSFQFAEKVNKMIYRQRRISKILSVLFSSQLEKMHRNILP